MKALGRLFIVIWTIIYTVLAFCGGFILFPLLAYIFSGNCDDPMETIGNTWESGKKMIERFFDSLSNIKCKRNDKFWK